MEAHYLLSAAKIAIAAAAFFAAGFNSSNITDELNLTQVAFPNGVKINAETMRSDLELMRGLIDYLVEECCTEGTCAPGILPNKAA